MKIALSWKSWSAVAVAVLAVAGGAWWWSAGRAPDVSYRTARLERGPLQSTVSASGAVNPVTQVSVGTQVSGQIKELYVDFNAEVKAGQLIAQIDPETFEYRVRQAQADVDAAQAAVLTAEANGAAARAAVSRAHVDLAEARRDLDRKRMLVERQFIAQSEAEKAQALVNTSGESLKSAEAQLGVTQAQVRSAQANVAQRQAALAQARVDLARTRIVSPVNGIVIKRAVERGQTVAASLQAPELFVIAQNLQDMQVEASVDESDIGRIRPGQKASFTVDAFPGQSFEGTIGQVRKAAQNVANVVTYVAVVRFSNPGGRLLPGMTANVRVVTEARDDVLKVPNAALRVRIAGVEPARAPASAASAPAATATSRAWGFPWIAEAVAQPAGGGGFAAMRERLTTELQLDAAQQAKLEAIGNELRPQFMALRELPEGERAAAREKVQAQMRERIAAILTPAQRAQYAQSVQGASQPGAAPGSRGAAATGAGTSAAAPAAAAASRSAPATAAAQPNGPSTGTPAAPSAPAAAGANAAAPAGGPGGPAAEFRNRLVTELQLTPAQVEKVDAIYAEARPKFGQLRDLPAEERGKARERITADIRARIADLLSAEQKPKYAALVAEAASRTSSRGRIFLLGADGKPRAFDVRLGITDGTMTELLVPPGSPQAVDLKEGATVITGVIGGTSPANPARPAGPRMPF
ncbi:efflux RND transporter periplasmic adaptor subunit [Ramlibacter sp. MAHUQ-53]|uniref:efflux RND transporter periplasmic adaptor subunit n=1 Tax=unclassified Ramlibacter TaxID=2617605 RepID=UPI0036347A98